MSAGPTWLIMVIIALLAALAIRDSTRYTMYSSVSNRMRWNDPNDPADRKVRSRISIELKILVAIKQHCLSPNKYSYKLLSHV